MHLFELQFCLAICLAMGLLDHMASLFLVLQGAFILFSIVAAPVYIPTHGSEGLPPLNVTVQFLMCLRLPLDCELCSHTGTTLSYLRFHPQKLAWCLIQCRCSRNDLHE